RVGGGAGGRRSWSPGWPGTGWSESGSRRGRDERRRAGTAPRRRAAARVAARARGAAASATGAQRPGARAGRLRGRGRVILVQGEARAHWRSVSGRALPASFYARPTPVVARGLLGHVLVSEVGGRRTAGRIVETEAYVGPDDPACHGYGARRTRRNATLFERPGTAYVYFTYGMPWCLKAVTEREGFPAAVLIRALEPLEGLPTMRRRRRSRSDRELCSGPAKLCQALGVTGREDGVPLTRGRLRIVRPRSRQRDAIIVTPRIGITRAVDWPLRFLIAGSLWVSR